MTTKIFVGSLPSGCKPEELRHLFEGYGVVTECDVMNRCGFVHMESGEMAATAIKALNSTEFKGETINVEPGRIRERSQKTGPGGQAGEAPGGGGRVRNRGRMGRGGPQGMKFDNIDDNTTKDALQLCSAVFEEMNKLLNPNGSQGGPRRGGNGGGMGMALPKNFANQLEALSAGNGNNRRASRNRNRNNRNNGENRKEVQNQANVAPVPVQGNANKGNAARAPDQGNTNRGQSQGSGNRAQNQGNGNRAPKQANGNQGNGNRNQNQGNGGRAPKQGNAGPIRNEPARPHRNTSQYNRNGGGGGGNAANINFADDVPIAQSARNFANNLAGGSQIEGRWPKNNGNFGVRSGGGGNMNSLMGRNFDEDTPVNNFNDDPSANSGLGLNNLNNLANLVGHGGGGMGNQGGISNHGNFGNNLGGGGGGGGGGNDRFQSGGNDRFQRGDNDRYQSGGNDRFQSGGNYGMGNQDRRGFALPERQIFNDNQKFGNANTDFRGGNSQLGGLNNQGGMGGGNRNNGFGNNSGRQQSNLESRNLGGGGGGGMGGNSSPMFSRRTNNQGNLDGNNMGNNSNRMRNDISDNNRGGNFGGGNANGNNAGYNRNNMGGNNSNRNMGGGGGGGNNMRGGEMSSMNFQKDFPPLSSGQNMNNRNGPRQNMMSNRRY